MVKKYFLYTLILSALFLVAACDEDENEEYPYGGYEYVDLGLPSGLKWATMNVGATKPIDVGNFYSWGELATKSQCDFTDYKFCSQVDEIGAVKTLTKYGTTGEFGIKDNLTQLEDCDDVVRQLWGNDWRMPTLDDINELLENCEITFGVLNGKQGTTFVGPNGTSIFMPLTGTRFQGNTEYEMRGYYWSSTLDDETDKCAKGLFVSAKFNMVGKLFTRCSGRCIRPVHD